MTLLCCHLPSLLLRFNGFHKLHFRVLVTPTVDKLLFATFCTLPPPITTSPAWPHWEEACAQGDWHRVPDPSGLRNPWSWDRAGDILIINKRCTLFCTDVGRPEVPC